MKISLVMSIAIMIPAIAGADVSKVFQCANDILVARIDVVDHGNRQADAKFSVRTRAGKKVLEGREKNQNYFSDNSSGVRTYQYLFGYNPKGGGYSQPLMSIWMTTNDMDKHDMVYFRLPYVHEDLKCTKLR